jgi:hypothetical protein
LGTSNVFGDLGYPDAEERQTKLRLTHALNTIVDERKLRQAEAALLRYAQEATWREDNRRVSNGDQVSRLAGLATKQKPSVDFSGYWQRHLGD